MLEDPEPETDVCLYDFKIAGNQSSYLKETFGRFSLDCAPTSGENNVWHQLRFAWRCRNTRSGCTNCTFVTLTWWLSAGEGSLSFPRCFMLPVLAGKVCCYNVKRPRCTSTLIQCFGHLAVSHRVLPRSLRVRWTGLCRVENLKGSCIVHCIQCSQCQRNISWSLCALWGTCSSTPGTKFTKPKGTQILCLCDLI